MSEIPPLRVSTEDGSFNQIPVFHLELSGGVVTKLSPTKINLAISGSQGPSGPPGASGFTVPLIVSSGGTGLSASGSAHTLLGVLSDGSTLVYYALLGSNNTSVIKAGTSITVSTTTADIAGKQDSVTFPLITGSGGTGLSATGSAHTLLGVLSDGSTLVYYAILGSNNTSVTKAGTSITVSATTADISGKQDSLTIPLIVGSGGTGRTVAGSATTLVGVNSSGSVYDYFLLAGSNSTTVTRSGTSYVISTITSNATGGGNGVVNAGSAGNLAYYASEGTAIDDLIIGSAHTLVGVNSSGASHDYYHILASANTTILKSGTAIYISADTGAGGGAPTTALYVVMSANASLANELVLTASNSTINISTDGSAVYISANTGGGAGGGTFTQYIPMALLTVNPRNANAFWNVKTGANIDDAHVSFLDASNGLAEYWCWVPSKTSSTENWSLAMEHGADTGSGGTVLITLRARITSDGSTIDAAPTVLTSTGSFTANSDGKLSINSASSAYDGTLSLLANTRLRVVLERSGGNAADTVNAQWNLKNLYLKCDVDS